MDIYEALDLLEQGAVLPVQPVAAWKIEESWVTTTPDTARLLDDDPVLRYTILFDVTYAGGGTQAFKWSTWYYGRLACPIVFSQGSGPPGYLEVQQ